jgi:hypothetical protein
VALSRAAWRTRHSGYAIAGLAACISIVLADQRVQLRNQRLRLRTNTQTLNQVLPECTSPLAKMLCARTCVSSCAQIVLSTVFSCTRGPVPPLQSHAAPHARLRRALHRRPHRDLAREHVGDLARGGAVLRLLREHVHDQLAQLLAEVRAERLRRLLDDLAARRTRKAFARPSRWM